jgi:hypothetical protein
MTLSARSNACSVIAMNIAPFPVSHRERTHQGIGDPRRIDQPRVDPFPVESERSLE